MMMMIIIIIIIIIKYKLIEPSSTTIQTYKYAIMKMEHVCK